MLLPPISQSDSLKKKLKKKKYAALCYQSVLMPMSVMMVYIGMEGMQVGGGGVSRSGGGEIDSDMWKRGYV